MRGYACSNCGAAPNVKVGSRSMASMPCTECGRLLTVKLTETATMVIAKVKPASKKRKICHTAMEKAAT